MPRPSWREEAVARKHDRRAFDCGDPALNSFLQQHARQAHESGASKTYVAVDAGSGRTVHGFYTLSPAEVEFHRVPEGTRCKLGRHAVGGYRLGRLAVSKALHGQGLGGQLLVAAARRCMRASQEVGGTAMMIDAKNEKVAAWYALYGGVALLDAPLSLVLPFGMIAPALRDAGKL